MAVCFTKLSRLFQLSFTDYKGHGDSCWLVHSFSSCFENSPEAAAHTARPDGAPFLAKTRYVFQPLTADPLCCRKNVFQNGTQSWTNGVPPGGASNPAQLNRTASMHYQPNRTARIDYQPNYPACIDYQPNQTARIDYVSEQHPSYKTLIRRLRGLIRPLRPPV